MTSENEQSDFALAAFLGGAVVLIGVIIIGYGFAVNPVAQQNQPVVVENFEETQSSLGGEQTAELVEYEDGTAVIKGQVLGPNSGMKPVLKEVNRVNDSNQVNVYVKTEKVSEKRVFLPAFHLYGYELTLSNLDENDNITVKYGKESFNLSTNDSDNMTQNNQEPNVDFEQRSSNAAGASKDVDFKVEDNKVIVDGVIVGNTGGQTPRLVGSDFNGDSIVLNVGLERPDGFATQVITGYSYRITVENTSGYDKVVVKHQGKEIGTKNINTK